MNAVVINADVEPCAANPHSWMPLIGDPAGDEGTDGVRVLYGVLREHYRGYANSAAALARAKLTVGTPPDPTNWTVSAHRLETILPAHADDRLMDPRTLFDSVDAEHPVGGKALATYVTLTWSPARLQAQFRIAADLARWLADSYQVAVLAVQHVPSLKASSAAPHVHLVFAPRVITRWSTCGEWVTPFCRDAGRDIIVERLAGMTATASPS